MVLRKQMYHMLERGVPNEGYAPLFVFSVFECGYVEFLFLLWYDARDRHLFSV